MKKCRKCREEKEFTEFPRMNIGKGGVGTTCFKCMKLWQKPQKPQKELKRTPLKPGPPPKKVGQKRRKRIDEKGSEYKVFIEIWKERKHICDNCNKPIRLFDPSCFAHIKNKRDHPDLRYDKENIGLVHGIWETIDDAGKTYQCHKEFDLKMKKLL